MLRIKVIIWFLKAIFHSAMCIAIATVLIQTSSASHHNSRMHHRARPQIPYHMFHRIYNQNISISIIPSMKGQHQTYFPYGIVPYSFHPNLTRLAIVRRVMETYEKMSCIRFVPRISRDGQWAKDLYLLGHDSYIEFRQNDTCFGVRNNGTSSSNNFVPIATASAINNMNNNNMNNNNNNNMNANINDANNTEGRTIVNGCTRDECFAEIALAVGLIREYQNPKRDGFLRVNYNNIPEGERKDYIKAISGEYDINGLPFDFSSPLGRDYSEEADHSPISLLTTDMNMETKDFYMFQEISERYRCHEDNCSQFHGDCVNDGYVTMIQAVCKCRCPEGLDSETGCATVTSADTHLCGGVFDLTDHNPTVNFSKPPDVVTECSWLIKAPVGTNIILDFHSFDVSTRSTICEDEIDIRYSRLGLAGNKFCGTSAPTLIRSHFNNIMVTFRPTKRPRPVSSFNATARLVSPETLCYNPEDKGFTYDGLVNYTRNYTPCIDWLWAAHCPHNPYSYEDMTSKLDENYCRNPGNGMMPWCYVDATNCRREYCDVCMLDTPVDHADDCITKESEFDYCNGTNKDEIRNNCAKTCQHELFSPQPSAHTVTCGPPPTLQDSIRVDNITHTSFSVGEHVTYRCRHVNSLYRTEMRKYCLSGGGWTGGTSACLPCHTQKDYILYGQSCYAVHTELKTANQHQRMCELQGGNLADVKSMQEQEFITKFGFSKGAGYLHIGVNDMYEEGTFRFRDFSPVTWTHWDHTNVNEADKDCVWTNPKGQWLVGKCNTKHQAVCKIPMLHHRRRGRADCSDSIADCRRLLEVDGQMCSRADGSFAFTQCPQTCGRCF